jgi:hypothetical protein
MKQFNEKHGDYVTRNEQEQINQSRPNETRMFMTQAGQPWHSLVLVLIVLVHLQE